MARARRYLLVAPSEMSTGEAVTLVHVAEDLERAGASCLFLSTVGARRFIEPRFAGRVQTFDGSLVSNQRRWCEILDAVKPDAIIFGDYPLLFFSSGAPRLADDCWVEALERAPAALFTLDHLGYAQRQRIVSFGPPHMTFGMEVTRTLPERMQVLLPCPVHDPHAVDRVGIPFRAWTARKYSQGDLQAMRARFVIDDRELLVLHSTPSWAIHLAQQLGLPHHRYLSRLLAEALFGLERPVVVVSINADRLLQPIDVAGVRVVNAAPMPPDHFERLIAAADLMLTDNAIAVSLGKAVCSLRPCALLANSLSLTDLYKRRDEPGGRWAAAIEQERPGAIFPWDVFPIWSSDDIEQLGFGAAHPFRCGYARIEAFGGETTRAAFASLLEGDGLVDAQLDYVARVATLPTASDVFAVELA